MSDFTTAYAAINLDPYKRVHYAPGLVLGVEDFAQEELYLLGRDRLHNRALHGYGTVCGLAVTIRPGDGGAVEILVRAGIALDPQGREIRVPQDQCAGIDAWLAANAGSLAGSPLPDPLPLYLVLCYRECTTDDVPVPGGPCRSLEDSRVPSRIADDFLLELRSGASAQVEEDAVRAFGDLLRAVEVSDAPGDFLTGEELNDLVRGLAGGSPTGFLGVGSPGVLRVHPADAPDLFQDAFRVWVTEVRPALLPDGGNCANGPPADACVLLARIELALEEVGGVPRLLDGDPANAAVDESRRPYLLHTRLLQEWLRNRSDTSLGAAGGTSPGPTPIPSWSACRATRSPPPPLRSSTGRCSPGAASPGRPSFSPSAATSPATPPTRPWSACRATRSPPPLRPSSTGRCSPGAASPGRPSSSPSAATWPATRPTRPWSACRATQWPRRLRPSPRARSSPGTGPPGRRRISPPSPVTTGRSPASGTWRTIPATSSSTAPGP